MNAPETVTTDAFTAEPCTASVPVATTALATVTVPPFKNVTSSNRWAFVAGFVKLTV